MNSVSYYKEDCFSQTMLIFIENNTKKNNLIICLHQSNKYIKMPASI